MFERFKGKERSLVAGIKTPIENSPFVKSLMSLAKRSSMRLKLTHVVEPWTSSIAIYPGEYISSGIARVAELNRVEAAKVQLEESLKPLLDRAEIEMSVMPGHPADSLRAESQVTGASLVACSAKPLSHRFIPKGFSTALELMAESSIPVVVFPEGRFCDFSKEHLTVLVCDDLTQTSADALPTAAEFVGSLGNTELIHFHVHPESVKFLKTWANAVTDMIATHDFKYGFPLNKETIVTDTENAILKKMSSRLEIPETYLAENVVNYVQKMAFGDVFDELAKAVESHKPDLIAFGRHHFLHKHPVSVGKMPFYAMLNLNTPIMVISNIGRLN